MNALEFTAASRAIGPDEDLSSFGEFAGSKGFEGFEGKIYPGGGVIFHIPEWREPWWLIINNHEWTGEALHPLELRLYDWCLDEGLIET